MHTTAILDFTPPQGFTFYLSKAPTSYFKSSYRLQTFPLSSGSLGYVFTSRVLDLAPHAVQSAPPPNPTSPLLPGTTRTAMDAVDSLQRAAVDQMHKDSILHQDQQSAVLEGLLGACEVGAWNPALLPSLSPTHPHSTVHSAGHYLVCGQLFLPARRFEALYLRRLSPRTQFTMATVSSRLFGESETMMQLQYDCAKWCTELSYSAADNLFGLRGLYNLGAVSKHHQIPATKAQHLINAAHTDEDFCPVSGFAVGGELYLSQSGSNKASGGLSVGVRHRTLLPRMAELTCIANPIMGHLATAYTATVYDNTLLNSPEVGESVIMSTRFNFNFYSLYSDLALGMEWRNSHNSLIRASISTSNGVSIGFDCRYRKVLLSVGANVGFSQSPVMAANGGSGTSGDAAGALGMGSTTAHPLGLPMVPGSPFRSIGINLQFFA
ncbi:Mitochondrial distribution and morphology protein 10 [Dimargaris verticillata]|uniref:Mitochondrial distribution and morphology protein 10 n=1 Tax=Dimargaris verticillata TaxID=2761393 RepID=A0A9W8AZ35_9FUNG|nr:Mitochondrial distribution and morphology protein 10 [Dimargaris verticillata]